MSLHHITGTEAFSDRSHFSPAHGSIRMFRVRGAWGARLGFMALQAGAVVFAVATLFHFLAAVLP
jgi:hypothetical protein